MICIGKTKCTSKKGLLLTVKNYLKESLLSILCFIVEGKGSSEMNLILNSGEKYIYIVMYGF